MIKFVIALALTIATLAAVPAWPAPTVKKTLVMAERAASAAAVKWPYCARQAARAAGARCDQMDLMEDIMPRLAATLVTGLVAAFLGAAICISTIDRDFAQSRLGQIAYDGLTNRYEPPQSETEVQLRRNM